MNPPEEMTKLKQWMSWEIEDGSKIPKQLNGQNAKTNNASTWTTSDKVKDLERKAFVITSGDPYCGIDLDNCLDEKGMLFPWAVRILSRFDGKAFAEYSPGGRGIKLVTRATKPKGSRCLYVIDKELGQQVEVYDHARFWTITGESYNQQNEIKDGTNAVEWVCSEFISPPTASAAPASPQVSPEVKTAASPQVSPEPFVKVLTPREESSLMDRMAAYTEGVAPVYKGQRNTTAFKLAGHLHSIEHDGEMPSQDQVLGFVMNWNRNLLEPMTDDEVEKVVISSKMNGKPPRKKPRHSKKVKVSTVADISKITGKQRKVSDVYLSRESMEQAPGLIGDMVRWMATTCLYDLPEMFLASSLALMSLIVGRKVKDELENRPNLYLLSMGKTGSGKEHARGCVKNILEACETDSWIAPENIGSSAGLATRLKEFPASLFQIDEFGSFLKNLSAQNAVSHIKDIESDLLRLYTSASTTWVGKAYADSEKIPRIVQPYLVISGACTPSSLWEAMTTAQVHAGLLGRLHVFESPVYVPLVDEVPYGVRGEGPPQDIINRVKWWIDYNPGGNLNDKNPVLQVLKATPEARERLETHMREIALRRIGEDDINAAIWSRSAEKANKLAMLAACARQSMDITLEDADWAIYVQNAMTRKLTLIVEDNISDTVVERSKKKMLSRIDGRMKLSQLARVTQFCRDSTERKKMLNELHECGKVVLTEETEGNIKTLWITTVK